MRALVDSFLSFLPQLFGAVVIAIIGVIIAVVLRLIIALVLRRLQFDALCERTGITKVLTYGHLRRRPSQLLAALIFYGVLLYTILSVVGALGLTFVASSLNLFLLSTPRLLTALAILICGFAAAGLLAEGAGRILADLGVSQVDGLKKVIRLTIIFLVVVLVGALLGVDVALLIMLMAIILGGLALTAALAVGLGLRSLSQNIAASRYVADGLAEGDQITLAAVSGTVEEIGHAMTTVRADDGTLFLVPNHHFVEQVVTKRPRPE